MKKKIPEVSITELWEHFGGEVTGPDRSTSRKAKCVLHDDRNASASVDEDAGLWFCFVCNKGGDAVELVKEVKGVGFADAVAYLAQLAAGSSVGVPPSRGGGSLLPGGARPGRRGGRYVPPWSRL